MSPIFSLYLAYHLFGVSQSEECVDTPDWEDGYGANCDVYRYFCDNDSFLGASSNYPENNCCGCGIEQQVCENKIPSSCSFSKYWSKMTCAVVVDTVGCEEKWSNVDQYWSDACKSTSGLVKDNCKLTCGMCDACVDAVNGATSPYSGSHYECKEDHILCRTSWYPDQCTKSCNRCRQGGFEILKDKHCGGEDIISWDDGTDANYGTLTGLSKCERMCNAYPECTGFVHHASENICGFWKKGTLNPSAKKDHNCHKKLDDNNE